MSSQGELNEQGKKDKEARLKLHIYPIIPGTTPINEITREMVIAVLDRLREQRKYQALKKVKTLISQIFQQAIDDNISGVTDWTKTFKRNRYTPPPSNHRAALTKPSEVAGLMQATEEYRSINLTVALAMRFSAMTFLRPKEVRMAEWQEFDLNDRLWTIPGEKMKRVSGQAIPHLVPLAAPVIDILTELKQIADYDTGTWVFPGTRQRAKPMCEIAVLAALRRLGYAKTEMCAHGFRGTASTLLNAHGFNKDWIELQLGHVERNKSRKPYNHYDFLQERRKMMAWWAEFLVAIQNDNPTPPLPI